MGEVEFGTHNGPRTCPPRVSDRRFGSSLSLLRQGFSVERQFGLHSLEALISVAETIEESVYERDSLARSPNGLTFRLTNPPLRTGAFSSVRISVDGVWVPLERVRFRSARNLTWRSLRSLSAEDPLELVPGSRFEFTVEVAVAPHQKTCTLRLELQSIAIPPLVWFEFTDILPPPSVA